MSDSSRGGALLVTDRLLGTGTSDVVDPTHPVDYKASETPPNYKCGKCGATGRKLWREYQTFLDHQTLLCCDCAAVDQGKDISDIDESGRRSSDLGGRTDQIGWYVPAVPTPENNSFWGYTSVPEDGCVWWRRLPIRPTTQV